MATNSGINYQQRVSAAFLSTCLVNYDISILLNYQEFTSNKIKYIQLEGEDKIDDLIITLNDNKKILCQIKRTLNLSDSKSSEFYKTIEQFIRQYLYNQHNERYFLITSSNSSDKIIKCLHKLLDCIKLNDFAFSSNPLNKLERIVLDLYKKVVKQLYKKYSNSIMDENEFVEFSKKVYIQKFDIENNSTMENAILVLLSTKTLVSPNNLWEQLISNCLNFASNRMSVSSDSLLKQYKMFLKSVNSDSNKKESFFEPSFENFNIASGKEVILCKAHEDLVGEINDESPDYLIIELFRFDDECNKKLKFRNNQCIFFNNTISLELICRFSTYSGLENYINDSSELFNNKSIALFPANNIDYIESSNCAKMYSETLMSKLNNKSDYLKCIECNKGISENYSYVAEIDEEGLENDVGLIHNNCMKPTTRILGKIKSSLFSDYPLIKRFDWELWIKQLLGGQGLFNNRFLENSNSTIFWNSNIIKENLDYCIKENLEDGTYKYIIRRGQVERFRKNEALQAVEKFNKELAQLENKNNYYGITSKNSHAGNYSTLKKIVDIDEKILKVTKYEIEKVSKQIIDEYKSSDNYYAPLVYLQLGENQEIFTISNFIILLTNPLELDMYFRNWERLNISIDDNYEIVILDTDEVFDNFMRKAYNDGFKSIVNPIVDLDGNLINGHKIENLTNYK